MGLLVVVTGIYAWRTFAMSTTAKKQANVSVKMAEEMRKQTETLRETVSMSVRPSVSIDVTRIQGGNTYSFEPPSGLSIRLQNKGKGPARNLVVTCEGQGNKVEYTKMESPSLDVGGEWSFSLRRITSTSDNELRVAYVLVKAVYNDELGEGWRVTLQIDKDGTSWKPGEITTERIFGGEHD